MDDTEYAIFQLAQEAKTLVDKTPSAEAHRLLEEASRLLSEAATAHQGAPR